jgi:hypothetical protein
MVLLSSSNTGADGVTQENTCLPSSNFSNFAFKVHGIVPKRTTTSSTDRPKRRPVISTGVRPQLEPETGEIFSISGGSYVTVATFVDGFLLESLQLL